MPVGAGSAFLPPEEVQGEFLRDLRIITGYSSHMEGTGFDDGCTAIR
ncbi:MAG: hypothetical protein LUQ37_03710 [Methanoregulaceae archaeon]|jgi:hypothetical protein|nr:hypothetical protein [Methanoregulaceae archaeon]